MEGAYSELLIPSVNYADYLAITLPLNAPQFDRVIVTTSRDDVHTQQVARRAGAEVITTDAWFEGGAPFNKGRGLNAGAACLTRRGWVASVDADTILPSDIREVMWRLPEKPGRLYWMKRRILKTREDYQQAQAGITPMPSPVNYGIKASGYCHIFYGADPNFDQLFASKFPTAAEVDMEFRSRWPKSRWICLPGACTHVGPRRTNWSGRRSPAW